MPLVILNASYPLLVVLLFFLGACMGSMDVAMNAQAVAVETRHGEPIMSAFHGIFSGAALLGAGLTSLMLSVGVAPIVHVGAVAVAFGALGLVSLRSLLPADVDRLTEGASFAWPTGPLVSLGIIGLLALVSEGAMSDWGAVYLHQGLGTTPAFAATGFAAFSFTMALGRFAGDALRARIPAVRLIQLSGAIAAAGLGIALLVGTPLATLVGFAGVGIGLSNVVPVVFSVAGQTPGMTTGNAVAAVATSGYLGFLIGPPTIGFVSQATNLRFGLAFVVVTLGLIALLAGQVRPAVGRAD
jgi:hypothetical protein